MKPADSQQEKGCPCDFLDGHVRSFDPEMTTIPTGELQSWRRHIAEAAEPNVAYNEDKTKMLEEAYQKRGAALYFLGRRISDFISANDPDVGAASSTNPENENAEN